MTKTILILAIAAAFLIGTSMSFVVSNFEAEAKKEDKGIGIPPGIGTSPNDKILAKLAELKGDVELLQATGNDHGVILGDLEVKVNTIEGNTNDLKTQAFDTNLKVSLIQVCSAVVFIDLIVILCGLATSPGCPVP